jgi:hypothetical protein
MVLSFPSLFLLCVLLKKVIFPALARPRDEEPVVVEPHLVAAHVVLTVAVGRRRQALAFRKVGVVVLLKV